MPVRAMMAPAIHNALEAHPDQPERRCDERQQRRQHEGGKAGTARRQEAWLGCGVPRPKVRTASGKRGGCRHSYPVRQQGAILRSRDYSFRF